MKKSKNKNMETDLIGFNKRPNTKSGKRICYTKPSELPFSVEQCRKLLGKKFDSVSDSEIMELQQILSTLAVVAIKTYL